MSLNTTVGYLLGTSLCACALSAQVSAQESQENHEWPPNVPFAAPVGSACSIAEALRKRPIILATVEAQEFESDGRVITRQRIDRVYSGPPELESQTFRDISAAATFTVGRSGSWYLVAPPLEIGETGIWMLVQHDGHWYREGHQTLGLLWPARAGLDIPSRPDYDGVLKVAEAMQAVWNASNESARVKLLRDYATSDTVAVSVAAIRLLAEVVPTELQQFAGEVDLRRLRIQSQIAIDRAMMQMNPIEWRRSSARSRVLQGLTERADSGHEEASAILMYIADAAQQNSLDQRAILELLCTIINSAKLTLELRCAAVRTLHWVVNDSQVGREAYEILAAILERAEDERLVLAAALSIGHVERASDDCIARLILLRDAYLERSQGIDDRYHPIRRAALILEDTVRRLQKPKRPSDALH